MTNEEKAEKIASTYHYLAGGINNEETMQIYVEDACRQMAEWKDEQNQEKIIRIYNFVNSYLTQEANEELRMIIGLK